MKTTPGGAQVQNQVRNNFGTVKCYAAVPEIDGHDQSVTYKAVISSPASIQTAVTVRTNGTFGAGDCPNVQQAGLVTQCMCCVSLRLCHCAAGVDDVCVLLVDGAVKCFQMAIPFVYPAFVAPLSADFNQPQLADSPAGMVRAACACLPACVRLVLILRCHCLPSPLWTSAWADSTCAASPASAASIAGRPPARESACCSHTHHPWRTHLCPPCVFVVPGPPLLWLPLLPAPTWASLRWTSARPLCADSRWV